ncbi:lipid-A-disaccharide synthase [Chlorobaculum parvum NCIB 8327]|uniref:Lipid-A-disaccharide synthase n=1 Tax=Chlorobaculum parvum (strain DSM 263 / NCIMB 8327) TaxID=517417 RepID=B3QQE3_CHLP8|nr:lipid-A-disaccharide synthase [Chlorobaculum parvum]ACF12146.1 lipid-A-disaccharide synthase [Chlorobaculum parvum NCIB 8327]
MMQFQQPTCGKTLFVLAGEVSGDLHAAGPVRMLLEQAPDTKVFGVGGRKLAELGAELLYTTDEMSIMGFVEVLKQAPFLRKVIRELKAAIVREKPDAALLVDYPGMNLHLAAFLKKQGIPVIYYISPQVWAWKERRVEKIRAYVDRLLVIFNFEVEFFRRHGIEAEFVGNPVVEELAEMEFPPKPQFLEKMGIDPDARIIGLLPGSRRQEIEKIFPEMLGAAKLIQEKAKTVFLLGKSSHIDPALYERHIRDAGVEPFDCTSYEVMQYSDLELVTSGTATLESLCFAVPMVVLYKTSPLNYFIGKRLVKLNNIALANIVSCGLLSEKQAVPELIQHEANAENISRKALDILCNEPVASAMRRELQEARARLSSDSPSRHVAAVLLEYL